MSLSDDRVISTLNRYYVPVYLANEDYRKDGPAPPDERAELSRIHREGYAAKLSVGTVHAYVLAPDGKLLDSRSVVQAAKADELLKMLDAAVEKLGTKPGEPLVKPAAPPAPAAEPGSLRLHLTARHLQRKGADLALIETRTGDWSALPGEDWIVLTPDQGAKLLPSGVVKPGATWDIDKDVSAALLTRFYPPTENNDLKKNRLDEQGLKGTVVSVRDGVARARLEGTLKMKHPFYHKDDENFVDATVAGVLEWEPGKKRVRSLKLVTDQATYGAAANKRPFGVVLRSAP